MSASVFHLTSAASVNLTLLGNGHNGLYGFEIVNTNAAARFVKFYWGPPGSFSGGGDNPTVGTDAPDITVEVPLSSSVSASFAENLAGLGNLFMATTVNAADTDTTAVGAGDLILSIFIG